VYFLHIVIHRLYILEKPDKPRTSANLAGIIGGAAQFAMESIPTLPLVCDDFVAF